MRIVTRAPASRRVGAHLADDAPLREVEPLATQQRGASSRRTTDLTRVTLASFLTLLAIGGGTNYSLPIYLEHLTGDRGLPLDQVSGGTSVVFIVGSFVGLAVARWATTRDPRPAILVAGLVGGASIVAIGQVATVWQAYLAYAGMGISFIACGTGPTMLAVLRHAEPGRRARTLAVATVGISLGGVVISPIAVLTIDRWGFARATAVLGVVVALLVTGAVLFVMPPSPPPPRETDAPPRPGIETEVLESLDPLDVVRDVPYHRAVRSPALWLTTAATGLFFCAQIGGIAHVVRLCSERDLAVAGAVVAVLTASAVVARLIGSWMLEHVPLWRWVVVVLVLQATSLALFSLARSTPAVVAAALLLGIVVGNSPIIGPMMVVETFGMLDYPRIQALQQILVSIAQGVGPVLLSVVHDRLGGYAPAYLTAAVVSCSACLVAVLAGRAAGRVPRTLRQQGCA